MNASNFLRSQYDDPRNIARHTLQCDKKQLETLRSALLYEVNLRTITVENINDWDVELRSIIGDVDSLRSSLFIDEFISSVDKLQAKLQKLLHNLYLVCDILEKQGRITWQDKDKLYQKLEECPDILIEAIDCFHI